MGRKGKWDGEEMNLYNHQRDGIDFIIRNGGSGALFWEMGLGKTRAALEIYKHYRLHQPELRLFVICPISLIEGAWGEDIRKFSSLTYCNLHKDKFRKADIYLINFEAFISSKKDTPEQLAKDSPLMCVIDESSRCKNHSALTTKRILATRGLYQYRIVMSGTPAPNTELEYHPQISFVKPELLPENFYKFRNLYFCLQRGKQVMSGKIYSRAAAREIFSSGWKYAILPQQRTRLIEKLSTVAHWAKKIDCLDLPEQIDQIRKVEMTPAQRRAYKEMERDCITFIQENAVIAQVVLVKILKLRQISSSLAIIGDKAVEIPGCPKTKELLMVLEEAGGQQAIIWCNFRAEIHRLAGLLGDKAVTLYGETKDKQEPIEAFKSGKAQYLIAHPRSAGYGLTFVQCSLEVFFSLDYSFESYAQSRARIHRVGQVNKCVYIHLLCENSIDEEIYRALQNKDNAEKIVYAWIRKHNTK